MLLGPRGSRGRFNHCSYSFKEFVKPYSHCLSFPPPPPFPFPVHLPSSFFLYPGHEDGFVSPSTPAPIRTKNKKAGGSCYPTFQFYQKLHSFLKNLTYHKGATVYIVEYNRPTQMLLSFLLCFFTKARGTLTEAGQTFQASSLCYLTLQTRCSGHRVTKRPFTQG